MSGTEIIEQMRTLPTEEKRGIVEQIWKEFGDELGWVDPDLTPEQLAGTRTAWRANCGAIPKAESRGSKSGRGVEATAQKALMPRRIIFRSAEARLEFEDAVACYPRFVTIGRNHVDQDGTAS